MRRWNGWGDDTIPYPLPANAPAFLEERLGPLVQVHVVEGAPQRQLDGGAEIAVGGEGGIDPDDRRIDGREHGDVPALALGPGGGEHVLEEAGDPRCPGRFAERPATVTQAAPENQPRYHQSFTTRHLHTFA